MNKRLQKALTDRCKDMGLTQLAIDRLVELGGEGLTDEATDEEIEAKADALKPYAAAMQSEVTRKTSSTGKKSTVKQSTSDGEGEKGEGRKGEDGKGDDEMPEWARQMQTDLRNLKQENADLKAEKARSDRAALIADKAKRLGIPDFLMRRISIADDADIDKELTEYKQDLVNNGLAPKEQAGEPGSTQKTLEAEAEEWLKTLPKVD